MRRILIAVDLPDDEPTPEGEIYVGPWTDDMHDRFPGGLTGKVVPDLPLEIHAMLSPEKYPPGHSAHDPKHMYWSDVDAPRTEDELRRLDDEELVEAFETATEKDFEWGERDTLDSATRNGLIQHVLEHQEAVELPVFEWDSETIEWVSSDIDYFLRSTQHPEARL